MSRGRGPRRFGLHLLESLGLGAASLGAAAGAIGASYKVGEMLAKAKRLFEVRSENAVFIRLAERVSADLAECERLLALPAVKERMRRNPAKTRYVQSAVRGLREAIEGVRRYTRRVGGAGWYLGLSTRIWWLLDEHEKLLHRELELALAREGVLEAIGFLSAIELEEDERRGKSGAARAVTTHSHSHSHAHVQLERPAGLHDDVRVHIHDRVEAGRSPRTPRQDGFYDGQFDGPLSTRPRFWQPVSAGADFSTGRGETERPGCGTSGESGGEVPLRVHWPSKL